MIERINVYYDGTCGPEEPGDLAAYAFFVFDNDELLHKESGLLTPPDGTKIGNAAAEYLSLFRALGWLVKNRKTYNHVRCYGDTLMIVNHLNKEYPFKDYVSEDAGTKTIWEAKEGYETLKRIVLTEAARFRDIQFSWASKSQIREVRELAEAVILAKGVEPARITKEKQKAGTLSRGSRE